MTKSYHVSIGLEDGMKALKVLGFFAIRLVLVFFAGSGFFLYFSLLEIPFFTPDTILVEDSFVHLLYEAGGPRFFYLTFGTFFGGAFCLGYLYFKFMRWLN